MSSGSLNATPSTAAITDVKSAAEMAAKSAIVAAGQANSSSHNTEWAQFMRLVHNPKRWPADLSPSVDSSEGAKDAFN
eukprot:13774825-Alexandrium_andersonii.AAC.1